MAEDQNSFEFKLTNLALVVDGLQKIYPESKSVILYELSQKNFNNVRSNFKNIKIDENQLKIDISGTEIVFILENSYEFNQETKEEEVKEDEVKEEEVNVEEPKKGFFKRLFNL